MTKPDITVVIPTIPPRRRGLARAVNSVIAQDYDGKVDVKVAIDADKRGSAVTRNRALMRARTPWVAFLDDDDYFLPHHLRVLEGIAAGMPEADVIYSGCKVLGPNGVEIPRQEEWGRYTRPFDANLLRDRSYVPVTSLVRTDLAQAAQFGPPDHDPSCKYDDWGFYLRVLDMGGTFVHVPEVTWVWMHDGANTSGEVSRW